MTVQAARLNRCCGLKVPQPVIPPLSEVEGIRCSVKPASRCTLLSKTHKSYGSSPMDQLSTWSRQAIMVHTPVKPVRPSVDGEPNKRED
ncbi:hypothetical protein QL285_023302 [Trifolium repens]|nr:hypothetical protein QL285_023302 [Trifolium repens]